MELLSHRQLRASEETEGASAFVCLGRMRRTSREKKRQIIALAMEKMIGSWELSGLDEASLDRVLSFANLDAGFALCEAMNEGIYPATYSHAKVIMSLEYHGIELFL